MPRYINYFLVLFLLLIVFVIGFLTGARWQADRPILVSLPQQRDGTGNVQQELNRENEENTVQTSAAPKHSAVPKEEKEGEKQTQAPELSDEERRISAALEDPDFKRVHDHLMRENSIQMNLPSLASPDSAPNKESKPISERDPIRFSLPE